MILTDEEYLNLYYSRYKYLGSGSYAKVFAITDKKAIKVQKKALDFNLTDIEENGKVFYDSFLDGTIEIDVEFDSKNIDRLLDLKISHKSLILPQEKVFYKGKFIAYTMNYIEGSKGLDAILKESVHDYYSILFNDDLIRKIDNLVRIELVTRKIYITDTRIENILYKDGEIFLIDHEYTKTEVEMQDFIGRYNTFLFWTIIFPITKGDYYSVFMKQLLLLDINIDLKKMIITLYTERGFLNYYTYAGLTLTEYTRKYFLTEIFMDDFYKVIEMISEITKEEKTLKKH